MVVLRNQRHLRDGSCLRLAVVLPNNATEPAAKTSQST